MTAQTAYDRLLHALREHGSHVRANGDRAAVAQCPAHEDRNPSLSLRAIEGQALVYCHSGCATQDVMAALKFDLADLYDDAKGATYKYGDGRVVYRSPAKNFRQAGNTQSRPELYRLDRVRQAVAAGEWVFLVEGEKDVHALESLGAVATTAPMGAANVDKCDLSPLHHARLAVIPDQDDAGGRWLSNVLAQLDGQLKELRVGKPKDGKDSADHVAAGYGLEDFEPVDPGVIAEPAERRLVLTPASAITTRRVVWLWDARLALGILALLAGREGLGKSTFGYWLAARITRGELPGEHKGQPRAVLICATEDSWEHTIVPRLIAADADLERIYRVEVVTADDISIGLSLPRDLHDVEKAARDKDAALLLLDPLMSRISDQIDPHKDLEVRHALEPLTWVADRTGMTVLGIIHLNKTGSVDILDRVMGSKAFAAVARAVCAVVPDPDDDGGHRRLFGVPKNNLGRSDLPSLRFAIQGTVIQTGDGPSEVGAVVIGDETETTIHEAMERNGEDADVRTQVADAKTWLKDYLTENGESDSRDVKKALAAQGFSESTINRARKSLRVIMANLSVAPRRTTWSLPLAVVSFPRGESISDMTDINAGQGQLSDLGETTSRVSRASSTVPREADTIAHCIACGKPLQAYYVKIGRDRHPRCRLADIGRSA